MNDRNGHICPECGTPWGPGGSPTCECARRAADALLETRSAEAAAAEDFDPLRIRPYVDLGTGTGTSGAEGSGGQDDREPPHSAGPGAMESPHSTGPGDTASPYSTSTGSGDVEPPGGADVPADHLAMFPPEDSGPPAPSGATPEPPTDTALTARSAPRHNALAIAFPRLRPPLRRLRDPAAGLRPRLPRPAPADLSDEPAEGGSRRRRFALVGAGATAAVMAAAGFASGLFSYESPSRDSAAPDDIRASVPDTAVDEPSPSADTESPTQSPSASPAPSSSPSSTPSPTQSPTTATPSSPATTTRAPATSAPATSPRPPSAPPEKAGPMTLRRGDRGPEVTELQQRLQQIALYAETPDGDYDNQTETAVRNYQVTRGINNETPGEYDEQTRTRLETETSEPPR